MAVSEISWNMDVSIFGSFRDFLAVSEISWNMQEKEDVKSPPKGGFRY